MTWPSEHDHDTWIKRVTFSIVSILLLTLLLRRAWRIRFHGVHLDLENKKKKKNVWGGFVISPEKAKNQRQMSGTKNLAVNVYVLFK